MNKVKLRIFDEWREGKDDGAGGIPQCMLRMREFRSRQSQARKGQGYIEDKCCNAVFRRRCSISFDVLPLIKSQGNNSFSPLSRSA